jgi:hypothetical protein
MRLLIKTKALLGILAVLIVVNFLDRSIPSAESGLPSIPVMVKDDIKRIELSVASEKITLEREEETWMMKAPIEAKADWARIRSLILNFRKEIKMDALIDTDKEEQYGLDAGNAIIVEIWAGGDQPSASFLVGNDSAYGSTFVRISGSDSIYRARIGGRRRYALSANDWQNQSVLDFELEDFQSLLVKSAGVEPYQIVRDNGWKIDPQLKGAVEEKSVEKSIKSLSMLRIGKKEERAFVSFATFELLLASGEKIVFQSSEPKGGGVYLSLEGETELFRVASPAIERFLHGSTWFKDRRKLKFNTREEMDMIRFHTDSIDIIIQQDLSSGFWRVIQPSNIDLDMRQIFYMVNTLASLEAIKEIDDQDRYKEFFNDSPAFIDIRTLVGGVKTIEIAKKIVIEGTQGYLFRDKQEGEIFLVAEKDLKTILTAFGQSDFFIRD